jgi:hypothetical protein
MAAIEFAYLCLALKACSLFTVPVSRMYLRPDAAFDENVGLALASGSLAACCAGLLKPPRFLR